MDNFALHMFHYGKDIEITAKNIFPLNFVMIYGVRKGSILSVV